VVLFEFNLAAGGWDFYGPQIDILLPALRRVDEGGVQLEEVFDLEPVFEDFD
jgi:hypothetical protein